MGFLTFLAVVILLGIVIIGALLEDDNTNNKKNERNVDKGYTNYQINTRIRNDNNFHQDYSQEYNQGYQQGHNQNFSHNYHHNYQQENDDFDDMLSRGVNPEDFLGTIGSEAFAESVITRHGIKKNIHFEFSGMKVDRHGIPIVIRERIGKQLDCGHIALRLEDVLGICSRGHIICHRHRFYKCAWCGDIICDLDKVYQLRDGRFVCGNHFWGLLFNDCREYVPGI